MFMLCSPDQAFPPGFIDAANGLPHLIREVVLCIIMRDDCIFLFLLRPISQGV